MKTLLIGNGGLRRAMNAAMLAALLCTSCATCPDGGSSAAVRPVDLDAAVRPDLRDALAAFPKLNLQDLIAADRSGALLDKSALPSDPAVRVGDRVLVGLGVPDLRVRIYEPAAPAQGDRPAILYTHGGGHVICHPETYEAQLIRFAKEVGAVVVAPDYRLAPEYPYPADLDDCFAALRWMTDRKASGLAIDPSRVAVAGDSAGGGLTIAVALRARDEDGPAIRFILPIYPMLDCRSATASCRRIADTRVWNRDFNVFAWDAYLAGAPRPVPAYASPALADDVSGLPPAYLTVGTLDPFLDEDVAFAARMLEAGVPVELHVVPGAFHGFDSLAAATPTSRDIVGEYIGALKTALR